jgi:hypothetical protein
MRRYGDQPYWSWSRRGSTRNKTEHLLAARIQRPLEQRAWEVGQVVRQASEQLEPKAQAALASAWSKAATRALGHLPATRRWVSPPCARPFNLMGQRWRRAGTRVACVVWVML